MAEQQQPAVAHEQDLSGPVSAQRSETNHPVYMGQVTAD